VYLNRCFLFVLCAELVAEIPSGRRAPRLYVTIHHREGLLTVRASDRRAADKISGVGHHIAPPVAFSFLRRNGEPLIVFAPSGD
jgi:hypothetical protein